MRSYWGIALAFALSVMASILVWDSTAAFAIEGTPRGLVTWYVNYTGAEEQVGTIQNVSLTNCRSLGDCYLQQRVRQQLSIYFRAGESHDEILYNLYMTAGMSQYWVDGGVALRDVNKGGIHEFAKNFYVNSKIPSGNNTIKIYLFRPSSPFPIFEFSIEFAIDGVYDNTTPSTTTPTTLPPSTSTWASTVVTPNATYSPEPTTLTPETTTTGVPTTPSPFRCEDQGFYPDPYSCTIYHVCTQFSDGSYWDQQLECPRGTTFCPDRNICDYEINCPCRLR